MFNKIFWRISVVNNDHTYYSTVTVYKHINVFLSVYVNRLHVVSIVAVTVKNFNMLTYVFVDKLMDFCAKRCLHHYK